MKIPATVPGSAPYYHGPPVNGMEMNPQWQGNGVMLEGGPPGNGGPYMVPHHVHPAGYAPPSGYYGPPGQAPAQPQDFSEYMWMENEEEFDKQVRFVAFEEPSVMQQLEEEALMEQCIEAMLADEREAQGRGDVSLEEAVSKSTLNPLAAEFVPTFLPAAAVSVSESEIPIVSSTSLIPETPQVCEDPDKSAAQVTEMLSEVSLSKSEEAFVPEKETEAPSVEVSEPKVVPQIVTENIKKSDAKDSKAAKVIEAATAIVVVSAIDGAIKEDKTSRTEKGKSAERKVDLERKKSAESAKKEVVKKSDSKESVKKSDSKESVKKVVEPVKRASLGKVERGPRPEKQKAVAEVKKKVEEIVVDLQGPPLPSVAAPVAAVETEKPQAVPAAPAVFNYAAAARANLPPRQPLAPVSAPAKETTPTPAAAKPEPQGKETRSATAAKTKPAEKGGPKSEDKRPFKTAGPVKKGKK